MVAVYEEHHIEWHIQIIEIGTAVSRSDATQMLLGAQDVVSQLAAGEEQVLEIVVDGFARSVAIAVGFVHHHLAFALQFGFGKHRVDNQVGNQFGGSVKVFAGEY